MRCVKLATISAVVIVFAAGCSLSPKQSSTQATMVVSSATSLPVVVDGEVVGSTNQVIEGLTPGVREVLVGETENPVWSGYVTLSDGQTTTVTPTEGQYINDGPPQEQQESIPPTEEATNELDLTLYRASLVSDFAYRDSLPQTKTLEKDWFKYSSWGPSAAVYPQVTAPSEYNSVTWKHDRAVEVARHFIGTPYKHYHIPQLGLDCSNFTSWVYNYGFGIKFTSSVSSQAKVAGRKLASGEVRQPGDLLYFWNKSRTAISHAALYINETTLIDSTTTSTTNGVAERPFKYWYKDRYAFARRIIE